MANCYSGSEVSSLSSLQDAFQNHLAANRRASLGAVSSYLVQSKELALLVKDITQQESGLLLEAAVATKKLLRDIRQIERLSNQYQR